MKTKMTKTNKEKHNTRRIMYMWIGITIVSILTFWTIIVPLFAMLNGIEKTELL